MPLFRLGVPWAYFHLGARLADGRNRGHRYSGLQHHAVLLPDSIHGVPMEAAAADYLRHAVSLSPQAENDLVAPVIGESSTKLDAMRALPGERVLDPPTDKGHDR